MTKRAVLVADEVWIATALLHRENPGRRDFAVREIIERARKENVCGNGHLRPGVSIHVSQHCVANKKPNPGNYRILWETASGRRRLYRPGDPAHKDRKNGKILPHRNAIPQKYYGLLDWYQETYAGRRAEPPPDEDAILHLRGLGKEIWVAENPDEYVRKLREGWE